MKAVKTSSIMRTKSSEHLSFKKMFMIFIIFSFIGCVYEDLLFMIKDYINDGTINFVTKRGL